MRPPILQTTRYTIQAYRTQDEDRFVEMAIDRESVAFMGGANGIVAEERALFQKILALYHSSPKKWFWIWGIYRGSKLCAHLELKETDHTTPQELEIVYMVHPKERRQGLMTEVLTFLKQQQIVWQRRLIATLSPENLPSIQLLSKWGIEKEETLYDADTGEKYLKLTLVNA